MADDEIVSKPDYGDALVDIEGGVGVASPRFQLYLDDITERMNTFVLGGGTGTGILTTDFLPSSILYRPSTGTAILPKVINGQELLGRVVGGEIDALGFVDIWSILDDGIADVTINDPGFSRDFIVKSNSSSRMLMIDGSADRIGISANSILPRTGIVHIVESYTSGGVVTAHPDGADLVLEHDFFGGMSILNGINGFGNIYWGDPQWGNDAGRSWFSHDIDFGGVGAPTMGVDVTGVTYWTAVSDQVDGATSGLFINPDQNEFIDFQVNTFAEDPFMRVHYDSGAGVGRLGISQGASVPAKYGVVHIVKGGYIGTASVPSTSDSLILESPTNNGICIMTPDSGFSTIAFGNHVQAEFARFVYDHDFTNTEQGFKFFFQPFLALQLIPSFGFDWNPKHDIRYDFRVRGQTSASCIFVDSGNNRVGISNTGTMPQSGVLHVQQMQGSSFVMAVSNDADTIVAAKNSNGGISIFAANGFNPSIYFGTPATGNSAFRMTYVSAIDVGFFAIAGQNTLRLSGTEGVSINNSQNNFMDFRVHGDTQIDLFRVDAGLELSSFSKASLAGTDGTVHIINGDAGLVTASNTADELVMEGIGGVGSSILVDAATGVGNWAVGSPTAPAQGIVEYTISTGIMALYTDVVRRLNLSSAESVFNPTGVDTDLRAESILSTQMFHVDAALELVSISKASLVGTEGTLHIINGDAGALVASVFADGLIIEDAVETGLSVLVPDDTFADIAFGSPTWGNLGGNIYFDSDTTFGAVGLPGIGLDILGSTYWLAQSDEVDGTVTGLFINPFQDTLIDFQVNTFGSGPFLRIDSTTSKMGLSQASFAPTDGTLHIVNGVAGILAASLSADEIVLENAGAMGLSFLVDNLTGVANIAFGDDVNGNLAGLVSWTALTGILDFAAAEFTFTTLAAVTVAADDKVLIQDTSDTDFIKTVTAGSIAGALTYAQLAALVAAPTADLIFNESAGDFDLRIEGVTSSHLFMTDATLNIVGISRSSLAPVHGALHIQEADAGAIAPSANADLLVLEGTGNIGQSFLVDNATGVVNIAFGDPSNGATAGLIQFTASLAKYAFFNTAREALSLYPTELVFNEGGLNNMNTRFESVGSSNMLLIDSLNNRIGIADNGFGPSDGLVHLFQGGAAGAVAASTLADGIVMESNAATGFTILVPNDGTAGNIFIGAPTTGNNSGQIIYVPFTGLMTLATSALPAIRIDTNQNILLGTVAAAATTAAGALHVPNDTSPTAVLANGIVIGSKDSGAGGSLAVPEIWIEEPPEAVGTFTPTMKMKIWVNGTEYFMQLDPV